MISYDFRLNFSQLILKLFVHGMIWLKLQLLFVLFLHVIQLHKVIEGTTDSNMQILNRQKEKFSYSPKFFDLFYLSSLLSINCIIFKVSQFFIMLEIIRIDRQIFIIFSGYDDLADIQQSSIDIHQDSIMRL